MHATLPQRPGARPATTPRTPHTQLDQQPADARFCDAILDAGLTWPYVELGPSGISVEGARALYLRDGGPTGPAESFLVGREFAHVHAGGDFSLHLALPEGLATAAIDAGWAEHHILVPSGYLPRTIVMLYAPRDEEETAVVLDLVRASYEFAIGQNPV
jgi:phospholipase/carboxylesterase